MGYLISDASDEEEFGTDDIVLPGSKRAQNKRSRTKFVLRKGEIVAVRNEDNSFYLCKGETDTLLHEMYSAFTNSSLQDQVTIFIHNIFLNDLKKQNKSNWIL